MTKPAVRHRVLATDGIDALGLELLRAEPGLDVDEVPTLAKAELLQRIGDYDALIVRSATKVNAEVLRAATKLRIVGRAGVGVDNIALDTATELGIAVVNAPAGNAIAVAELFFGSLLALMRNLPAADASMRAGKWDRSKFLGRELKGRTLGVLGLGRIGSEVAHRALAFGMSVIGYDPYVAEDRFKALRIRCAKDIDAVLRESDVLSIHTPLSDESRGMIGERALALLPEGAIVANLARGGILDEAALAAALQTSRLGGAILDVYETEPLPADSPLRSAPNVVLTPHLGASTVEAQRNVSVDVCRVIADALLRDDLSRSINTPRIADDRWVEAQTGVVGARRAAAVARAILADRGRRAMRRVTVRCGTALVDAGPLLLAGAAVGVLEGVLETGRINIINARTLAEARGLELALSESLYADQTHTIEVTLTDGTPDGETTVAARATPDAPPRITRIGRFHVDVTPRGAMIVLTNDDVPGVIGRVGTVLGASGVNIAEYHQARLAQGGEALAAISIDGRVPADVRQKLLALPDVRTATIVDFA